MLAAILAMGALGFNRLDVSADIAFTQCNDIHNVTTASTITCDVSIVNNLNLATGARSSTVTVTTTICSPPTGPCVTTGPTTTSYADLVTSVNQCNNSANYPGSDLKCNVRVTNNIIGNTTTSPATVNQCVGSGATSTLLCDPYPANTSGADITQCNGSANGGGNYGGQNAVKCTVLPSTEAAALRVTINQCNGSANGGGSSVTCTAQITNNVSPASSTATPTPTSTTGSGTGTTSSFGPGGTVPGLGDTSGLGSGSGNGPGLGANAPASHPVVINGRTFAAPGAGTGSFVSQGVGQASNTGGGPLS
ncbi:MAG: hypothetical protein ABR564_09005 [Candidatus Dormibacteria bacterium]